ncbi:hypothetical protein HFO56_24665 [Rhizobium laguerreae]|uniref:hypothetical protein n=1 Tax=Rhizobium laguerreae TaxID=1076926 RepID=UPI001C90B4B8|nr:hypothetical protein [Rhizobium laguerreae]MBY3155524.1 hypothetical protein [Rhizobium laguerreae]
MTNPSQTPRPAKTPARSSARNDLDRIEATGNPWWAQAPSVAMTCLTVTVIPLKLLALAADTAVSVCFLAVFGSVGLWYIGYIPDQTVAEVLGSVGQRLLGILEGTGLL